MFALVVRFDVREGHEQVFDELVERTVQQIHANEPGTVLYLTHAVEGDQCARVFYEVYESSRAKEFHDHQSYVQEFMDQRELHLANTRVEFLSPLAPWPEQLGSAL